MSDPLGLFGEEDNKDPLGLFDTQDSSFMDKAKGAGEAALNMATGAVAMPLGFLAAGMQKMNDPSHINFEEQTAANMGRMTYEPRTETGKDYAENVGKVVNELIPVMPLHGTLPSIKPGQAVNAFRANAARDVPVPNVRALEAELKATPKTADPLGLFDNLKSTEGEGGQMALFDQHELTQTKRNQFQAEPGEWRVDENGMPIRADLSMEAANLEQPLQRGLWGEELGPALGNERSLTGAIDSMEPGVPLREKGRFTGKDTRQEALKRLQGEIEAPAALEVAKMEAEGPKIPFNFKNQGGGVLVGEQKRLPTALAWLAKDKDRFAEPSSTDLAALTKDVSENGIKKPITITVSSSDGAGYITDGNNRLAAAQAAGLKDVPYKVEVTNVPFTKEQLNKSLPTDMLGLSADELAARPKSPEATAAEAWLKNFNENGPTKWVPKSQRGAVKIDWRDEGQLNQMKKIPGMDRRLKNLLPDLSTPEEFKAANKNTPDVEQNLVQRGMNMLTKGGVYQTLKTDNPLIKRVVDTFLEADNRAKAAIQEVVHDHLAPLSRALNKQEKADVWAAVKAGEEAKKPVTEDMLARNGFNQKQIDWAIAHQEVMGKMFEKLSESMKAAGIKPVSPQVAYVASRARGDFRRLVYDKEGKVIGILGANTRMGLERDAAKYKKLDPEAKIGEERYFGGGKGKAGTSEGFQQMLEFLSENDPAIKDFVKKVNEQASKDAFDYMNAKSHTMKKKGIFGMEGNKPFQDAVQNAEEGMQAQIRYAETMIKWAELSEAVKSTKELMAPENGLDMPNAKAYLKDYVDNALGKNPTELGRALEGVGSAFGKATGLGTSIPSRALSAGKQITNGLLLGLNPMFLTANLVQPLKAMPEMAAWLKSMGLEKSFDLGTGYSYLAKAGMDMMSERIGSKIDPVVQGALDFAKKHHVYSSDLFEASNEVKKTASFVGNKITQFGASQVEQVTRKAMFLAFTRMLSENGITAKQGLYEAARKATDISMNNYSPIEAPMGYNALGGMGRAAYNLMSYKHNELSRLSMFARELKTDRSGKPLLVNLASQVAFAGLMGTIGYNEANELVKFISNKLGKPTSLTKMLLDSDLSKYFTHGMFNAAGVDMTNRLGMQVLPGSPIDAVMPGAGKLVDVAKSAGQLVTNPNEYNAKDLARNIVPSVAAGPMDRAWFSPKNAKGEELALNRNKVQATAVRNDADKVWKTLGATGVNESVQKAKSYENMQIDQKYQEKRNDVVLNMSKEFFTSGKIPAKLIEKYVKYQGDPTTLSRELEQMAMEQHVDAPTLQLMKAAANNSITSLHKVMRRTGKE